jgi:type II secretory pathway component PulF
MVMFKYTARDTATGKKVQGTIAADSTKSVSDIIKRQGYSVIEVEAENIHRRFIW